jgi:LmbE family N-acetylglucosaminyl deacetylase
MTDLSRLGTTVVVWAHPDDETYLSGGTAAALVGLGQRVVAVTATRGEAGGADPSPEGRAATAWVRTAELDEALRILGVREHVWLGYEDGCCADADPERAVRRLIRLFDDVRPDTVLTFGPDGFTGHPDHRAVSGWVDHALERSTAGPRLLHAATTVLDRVDRGLDTDFGVFELGEPRILEPAELALRHVLDPGILRRKVAALLAQASQTTALVEAVGLERYTAWVAVEGFAEPALVPAH